MPLTYKNNAKDHILRQTRNIRYADGQMLFGFYNSVEIQCKLVLDAQQLFNQGDIFAREILTHRSKFDLKRFLGQYQDDWLRILCEAYVYDRLKCIYYGINNINMLDVPSGVCSFPGNIILNRWLARNSYNFQTGDRQPYTLYVRLQYANDCKKLFEQVFEICPDLKDGLSDFEGIYSYVNAQYESVLKGLFNAKSYLDTNLKDVSGVRKSLFEIDYLNTTSFDKVFAEANNPIVNSFLSEDGKSFYFIQPTQDSVPESLRNNETVFLARAVGIRSTQLSISNNNMYTVVNRNNVSDPFTRDEVYAVTGLKSELVPYSMDQIKMYLGINSYTSKGGSNGNNP